MNELFNSEPDSTPSLEALRSRYRDAIAAYEDSDTDETGDLAREVFNARSALELAERQAMRRAKESR